jgi:YVTN family beta-propeller protein
MKNNQLFLLIAAMTLFALPSFAHSASIVGMINGFSGPIGVAIAPNGQYAYVANGGNATVSIVNTTTNQITGTITGFIDVVEGVAISPNGKYAYVASGPEELNVNDENSTVGIVNTSTGRTIGSISGFNNPQGVAIAPNGGYAYVVNLNGQVSVVETSTGEIAGELTGFPFSPVGVAIAPNGQYAYVTDGVNNTVSLVDTSSGEIQAFLSGFSDPVAVAITPNGQYAYVVNDGNGDSGSGSLSTVATSTGKIIGSLPGLDNPLGVAIAPNGQYAYVTESDSVIIINISTGTTNTTNTITIAITSNVTHTDINQSILISNVTSGTGPYTYTYNPSSGLTVTGNKVTATSPGKYTLTETVTNETSHNTSNQLSLTFNSDPTVTISPASATIDIGQSETLKLKASGGSKPYKLYNWADTVTKGSCSTFGIPQINTTEKFIPTVSQAPCTFAFTGTVEDNVGVRSHVSSQSVIVVNPKMAFTIPATISLDKGQKYTYNVIVSGGTPTYKYSWKTFNGLNVTPGTCTTTATCIVTGSKTEAGNTISLTVTDSATVPVKLIKTSKLIVNNALTLKPLPSPVTLTEGQKYTFIANAVGGTKGSGYKYSWIVPNGLTITSGTCSTTATCTISGSTVHSGYNISVTAKDQATNPVTTPAQHSTVNVIS